VIGAIVLAAGRSERMGGADFYRQASDQITVTIDRLAAVQLELENHYTRWQSLESLAQAAKS